MRLLDLFSGIGGFSLGLERSGAFNTVAFCEIEPFCRKVLAKHWPGVPQYHDIRELSAERLAADGIAVDAICGGFPCQDISAAGCGAGIDGERSGLWSEYARLIGELRPRYAIVENVAALLARGLDRVLGDLAALGYDAEWHCIPASAVGAPHRRDRVWIIAHTVSGELRDESGRRRGARRTDQTKSTDNGIQESMADADVSGPQERRQTGQPQGQGKAIWHLAHAELERCGGAWWAVEPDVGRVVDGFPGRVARLKALGNAVVPQIPELIGRAIHAHISGQSGLQGSI